MRQKWKEEVWRNQSEIVLKSELAFKESLKVYEVDKHKERLALNFKLQSPFMTWQEKCNAGRIFFSEKDRWVFTSFHFCIVFLFMNKWEVFHHLSVFHLVIIFYWPQSAAHAAHTFEVGNPKFWVIIFNGNTHSGQISHSWSYSISTSLPTSQFKNSMDSSKTCHLGYHCCVFVPLQRNRIQSTDQALPVNVLHPSF